MGTVVRDMHDRIARRSFGAVGAAGAPVRVIHDAVAGVVHASVREGIRTGARVGAGLLAAGAGDDDPPLACTPRGSLALGVLNGLCGNHLAARGSVLAVEMGVRRDGRDVPVSAAGLAAGFPDAAARVAVFVHGLMEDDECWRVLPLRRRTGGRPTYGERLQLELGFTPVHVRYNSGLRVSDNGRALAEMLDGLVDGWPVSVEEIALVGHSMGGLLARSACHYAQCGSRRWVARVRHVFCLGTPHLGADAEKGLNVLGHALGVLPESRALARVVNARSVGIKDLRYGSCVEEDWFDWDPDEFLRDRCTEVPFLPDAGYYFVGASLREGPLGELIGDLLVRLPSASGRGHRRGRRIPFDAGNGYELSGVNHFELLNHPAVYEQIQIWLSS